MVTGKYYRGEQGGVRPLEGGIGNSDRAVQEKSPPTKALRQRQRAFQFYITGSIS